MFCEGAERAKRAKRAWRDVVRTRVRIPLGSMLRENVVTAHFIAAAAQQNDGIAHEKGPLACAAGLVCGIRAGEIEES